MKRIFVTYLLLCVACLVFNSCASTSGVTTSGKSENTTRKEKDDTIPPAVKTLLGTNCKTYHEFFETFAKNDSGTSLGSAAQADMQRWQQLWATIQNYNEENWADIKYSDDDLKTKRIDYDKGKADFVLTIQYRINPVCVQLYEKSLAAYDSTQKLCEWGIDTSFWRLATNAELKSLIKSGYYNHYSLQNGIWVADERFSPSYQDFSMGYRSWPRIDSMFVMTAFLKDNYLKILATDKIKKIRGEIDCVMPEVSEHYLEFDMGSDFKTASFVFKNIDVKSMKVDYELSLELSR